MVCTEMSARVGIVQVEMLGLFCMDITLALEKETMGYSTWHSARGYRCVNN